METAKQRLLEPKVTYYDTHLDKRYTTLLFLSDGRLAAGDEQGAIYIHQNVSEEKLELTRDEVPAVVTLADTTLPPIPGLKYPVCQLLQRSKFQLVSCHQSKPGSSDHSIMHFAQWDLKSPKVTYLGSANAVSQIEVSGLEKLVGITKATHSERIFTSQAQASSKYLGGGLAHTLESFPFPINIRAKALLSEDELLVASSKKLYKWNKQKELVPEVLYSFEMRQEEEVMVAIHSRSNITNDPETQNLAEVKVTRVAIGMNDGTIHVIDLNDIKRPPLIITCNKIPAMDRHLNSLAWLPNGDLIDVHNKKYFRVLGINPNELVHSEIMCDFEQMTISKDGRLYCLTNQGRDIYCYTFPRVQQYLSSLAAGQKILRGQNSASSYSLRQFKPGEPRILVNESPAATSKKNERRCVIC